MAKVYKIINDIGGGGGGGDATPFTQIFDATTDWGSPSGGFYTIDVTQATHGKSTTPTVQIYEKVGSDYEQVDAEITVNTLGDVEIKVTETLDTRFEGRIVIL